MPGVQPNHRALRILTEAQAAENTASDDPLERSLFHFVKTGEESSQEVQQACDLYRDEEYRHVMNALILSGAHEERVEGGLGIPTAVYGSYRHLFFDIERFPHALAKTRYVKQLNCDPAFRAFYEVAVERGPNELIERFRIGVRQRLEPEDVMAEGLSDMWSKFLSHRGFSVTSDNSKEALRWGEAALRAAKIVLDINKEARRGEGTVDDLRIALEIRNDTHTLAEIQIRPEDLVDG